MILKSMYAPSTLMILKRACGASSGCTMERMEAILL